MLSERSPEPVEGRSESKQQSKGELLLCAEVDTASEAKDAERTKRVEAEVEGKGRQG
jgi:hypothetical protein